MSSQTPARVDKISSRIRTIRGKKVILDFDLAEIYGVPTKALNQAVKRNLTRFPDDFIFQLTKEEAEMELRSRSQFVTLKRGMNIKYLPYAFTENGAIMAANVLNSPEAVRMSVFVVRAFVQMRDLLGGTKELAKQLAALEKKLTARLDGHEGAIIEVLRRVMDVLDPPPPPKPRRGKKRDPPAPAIMIATMEADPTPQRGTCNQDAATGFIRLNGPRLKVAAKVHGKKK